MSFFAGEFFGGEFHDGYYHEEPYVGVSVFFGGEFFDSGFFKTVEEIAEEIPEVKTGGKGDNPKKVRSIYKPTGLPPYRKTVERRVEETRQIHREVLNQEAVRQTPVGQMSLADIEAEIGVRLRQEVRDEEEIILMLLAAAAG